MEEDMCFAAIEGGADANDETATMSTADATIDLRKLDSLLTSRCIQQSRANRIQSKEHAHSIDRKLKSPALNNTVEDLNHS
jgi:hypothetical protein